ncbi:hypothetical protein GPECTOR_67g283 [Gonium pectorale]|uniref:Uncharacterized protein n=1 Tax=Gonium pectorale TaxID=33097 RepID=A0A150G3T6_GONPE|nr:hypothetical protein GPECTOR_67g283 [Gonium pectorale]|eukprot:KXZ44443.1 hypothetical protein GPECTOR_67g283 [Gonium pectorale]
MDYIFNHTLTKSDTKGPPDRWARPNSAFYITKGNRQQDEASQAASGFVQLSKVFDEDSGMRPRVLVPAAVNKASYGLTCADVEGAVVGGAGVGGWRRGG